MKARYCSTRARIEIFARSTFWVRASVSSRSSGPSQPSRSSVSRSACAGGLSTSNGSSKSLTRRRLGRTGREVEAQSRVFHSWLAASNHPEGQHRVGDLLEAGDVGALDVIDIAAAAVAIFEAAGVDPVHDLPEQLLELLLLPGDAGRILAHLEAGDGDSAGIGGLAGRVEQLGVLEDVHAREVGGHVGALGDRDAAVRDEGARTVAEQLVLGRAGKSDVARYAPGALAGMEGRALERICIFRDSAAALGLVGLDPVDLLLVDAVGIVDEALAVGQGQHLAAELDDLLGGMGGDVAGARDDRALADQVEAAGLQHVLEEVDGAVAGRLGPDQRAAIFQPLAGQHAFPAAGDPFVLAEHVADLARADADVAGGHVDVGADMAKQLGHEALAEAHDLAVALALGIEIGAALAAAHRQAGQRVLEGLLESEELQDRAVDRRVEADSALIGADRIVVLDPVAALDPDIVVVGLPADPERDHPVRLGDSAQDLPAVVILLVGDEVEDVLGHFLDRLDEFGLARIAALDALHEAGQIDVPVAIPAHSVPPRIVPL